MTYLEELEALTAKVPLLERQVAQDDLAIEVAKDGLRNVEAGITLAGLEGANKEARDAFLRAKTIADLDAQKFMQQISTFEVERLELKQRLSEAAHRWRYLCLAQEYETALTLIRAGKEKLEAHI